jgi:TonB family protein
MKYCPVCQTRYDEEIMRFCTKDGTPLIDEEAPNFAAMPSEELESSAEEDDLGAETVIRRKSAETEITNVEPRNGETSQRIVVPTSEPQVRAKQAASYQQQPPPKKTSTAAVVLLTILGTIVVLGGGLGIYWLMSGKSSTVVNSNSNLNANQDTNLNTNLNMDNSLFNINGYANANANTNVNANTSPSPTATKTPSPTPTKTPTPSPTPDDDDNTNSDNSNSGAPVNTRPTGTPTVRPSPSPTRSPVNVGNMNSRAVSLSKPVYPPLARQMNAGGQVPVQVTVDESGRVISAKATGGHPLLRQAAENAARNSRFNPVRVSGQAVKSVGTVVYNFVGN